MRLRSDKTLADISHIMRKLSLLAERVLTACSAVTTSMPLWCRYYDTRVASRLLARWCGASVTAGHGAHGVRGAHGTVRGRSLGRGRLNAGKGSRAGAGWPLARARGAGAGREARAGAGAGRGRRGRGPGTGTGGMAGWWMGWMLGVGGGGIAWGRWVWEWIWLEPRGAR